MTEAYSPRSLPKKIIIQSNAAFKGHRSCFSVKMVPLATLKDGDLVRYRAPIRTFLPSKVGKFITKSSIG